MRLFRVIVSILMAILLLNGCRFSAISSSQLDEYNSIAQYYSQAASKEQAIRFYLENNTLNQILLIRHGNPDLDKSQRIGFRRMRQFIYDYDTVRVKPIVQSPVQIDRTRIDTIYTSSIQRAFDTANQLFRDKFIIESDSLFREFEREVVPLPLIKMKPRGWSIWSRFFWVLGLQSRKIEGFGEAKNRSREISSFLSEKANENQYAVLVAHGFLNRYLKKELMKSGWQLSYDGGSEYLSVQVLSKIE